MGGILAGAILGDSAQIFKPVGDLFINSIGPISVLFISLLLCLLKHLQHICSSSTHKHIVLDIVLCDLDLFFGQGFLFLL